MEGLGRSVIGHERFGRVLGLGDRHEPLSRTPALISMEGDPEIEAHRAPFSIRDQGGQPRTMEIACRLPLEPPFETLPDPHPFQLGHVLSPSLEEANAGQSGSRGAVLTVTWQSLRHDHGLTDQELDPSLVILSDAQAIAGHPGRLIEALETLRRRFPRALLWCPGISGPDNLPVLTWFGVDLHDLVRCRQAASLGHVLTSGGPRAAGPDEDAMACSLNEMHRSIRETQHSILEGRLRSLVDQHALASPRTVEHLRRFDRAGDRGPSSLDRIVNPGRRFRCHAPATFDDRLVMDWVAFVQTTYVPPSDRSRVAVLLPCSARKPYRFSKSHRRFREAIGDRPVLELMVTSPLGIVPRELEDLWPAGHYDVPVTGDWSADELNRIHDLVSDLTTRLGFQSVIDHCDLGLDGRLPTGVLIETRQGQSAGSREALQRLREAVGAACRQDPLPRLRGPGPRLEAFRSISRRLLGSDVWMDGVETAGRPPRWRFMHHGTQLAMWDPDRSAFSFSKAGVSHLARLGGSLPEVHLVGGCTWSANLHGGMVQSVDPRVRTGDDVLVVQEGAVLGSVRATVPAWAWHGPSIVARRHQRIEPVPASERL